MCEGMHSRGNLHFKIKMSTIWQRVFDSMIHGVDMRRVLINSVLLSILSVLFIIPYFHYLVSVVTDGRLSMTLNPWNFLFSQLFFVFGLCFVSAVVGFSFSKRFDLPGFGDLRDFVRSIPILLVLGISMITLSYFLFDRYFIEISPISYPKGLLYLISFPFKGAFTEEIILRLCLVTLGVGLLRSKVAGVVLVSALASFLSIKYFNFVGIEFHLNYLSVTQLLLSFGANLLLGYLFVTYGLLYSMALKFLFCTKYLLISWVVAQ